MNSRPLKTGPLKPKPSGNLLNSRQDLKARLSNHILAGQAQKRLALVSSKISLKL